MASKLTKRAVIAAKQETTAGTAEALTSTEATFNCFNVSHADVDFAMEERPQQGGFTRLAATPGAKLATITFEVEAAGSGASGEVLQPLSDLLCACGYTVSGAVFTPTNDPSVMTCVTIGDYTDGSKRILAGCTGTFTLTVINGRKSMFKFTMTGKPAPDADASLLAPTYPTTPKPPRGLASLSVNSVTTLRAAQLVFDSGSVPHMLETLVNDTNSTGYAFGITEDRMTKVTLDPEATSVSVMDWDTLITASTEFALTFVLGATTHNIITVAAIGSKAQVVKRGFGARAGVLTENPEINLNQGATLTFT